MCPASLDADDNLQEGQGADFKYGNNAIKQVQKANEFKIHEKIIDPIDHSLNIIERKWQDDSEMIIPGAEAFKIPKGGHITEKDINNL